ncbi:helix-turn-helix transcriptional regulator [Clostridium sp. YIM B02551]|uniref:helix-turn-helix transcriptional regulator n=1 Tax=Clostridium sp. YIM B02551 TaxID=2910679 RepID=UPI001EEB9F7C|nr:helix-turn-helix transcriptional regulator [Clostridium sp. YIM B02551]
MTLKNKLKEIRMKEYMINQKEFAEFLGLNRSQYNKYENNKEQPSIEVFYKIAKKLNRKIDDIIECEKESND